MQKNLAIVDDDYLTREAMQHQIKEIFEQRCEVSIMTFSNGQELIEALKNGTKFDLLFLDIEIPGMDGITLAKTLKEYNKDVCFIYVSNREDLVFDSLQTRPFGFVRKSNFVKDVYKVIDAYFQEINNDPDNILILNYNTSQITINLNDLIYIESQGKMQLFYCKNLSKPYSIQTTFQTIQKQLTPKWFVNCYKGLLVNCRYIKSIKEDSIVLTTNKIIPISRRKYDEVKDVYLNFVKQKKAFIF